jgi:chaperonin GroEL
MLGSAEKAVISKDTCIIYDGHGDSDQIKDRLEVIKDRLKDPSVSDYEKTKFKARISGLSGGVAVIRAGGASETEKKNRKATIEDAILASQSAISEGVVPGGGWTLVKASTSVEIPKKATESEKLGYHVILDSLPIITKTIAENYGISGDVVVAKTLRGNQGFNAKTGTWGNLKADGVLDSAKALRVALENAVSAAGMCLLTDSVVYDEPEEPVK